MLCILLLSDLRCYHYPRLQEHVEYVVGRLNHEGRGIVEFLDYLTYVPLFVEIHDSISGNPLDFSRTK